MSRPCGQFDRRLSELEQHIKGHYPEPCSCSSMSLGRMMGVTNISIQTYIRVLKERGLLVSRVYRYKLSDTWYCRRRLYVQDLPTL